MPVHQEDVLDDNAVDEVLSKQDAIYTVDADDIKDGALQNKEFEENLKFFDALKKYRKAITWSCLMSCALIMEGFDHSYITSFFGFTEFQKNYGVLQPDGTYLIPTAWQTGISDGVIASEIITLFFVGSITEYFGYRWTMIISLGMMASFIFIQFFSSSLPVYLVGEILLGIPWGIFQTVTTTYAAEVCPVVLRGHLTVFVALCWTIGYLIGNCVMRGLLTIETASAYKIAFALQWVWPIPIAIACYFAPESPWLLVRKGKTDEAFKAARRLASDDVTDKEIKESISMMVHTDNLEKEEAKNKRTGAGSYLDLFKGVNFRRTEIATIVCSTQNIINPFGGWGVVFMEQAGMSTDKSFDFSIGGSAISVLAVFVLWVLMERKVSRRRIFMFGLITALINALIVGFLAIPKRTTGTLYAMAVVLLIESFLSFLGVQATIYPIISELPSNALRPKTVGFARAICNLVALINGILIPKMINTGPGNWGWGPIADLYYAGWLIICIIWAYFRLPDATQLTYAEIDILFENGVPARKFKSTKVDLAEGRIADSSAEEKA
ncbi:general alpha-glucoside permease [Trichomonascus vanleenenianus]|uniref:general alpha-glucoside permease n=1 Tax=Trichomonascus vanleenenianus TaxID=2268995 RepID=UPI003ECA8254